MGWVNVFSGLWFEIFSRVTDTQEDDVKKLNQGGFYALFLK